jgi:hypothetical protein
MVASVAVLSDIHGVLPALDAVLKEPDVAAAERIVLTGDIAAGPQPVDVLDRLLDLGDRVVWVRGNADRELVALARGDTTTSRRSSAGTRTCPSSDSPTGARSSTPEALACPTGARVRTGPSSPTAPCPYATAPSIPNPLAPPSATSHPTPRSPNGPTTSSTHGQATPMPSPSSVHETAVDAVAHRQCPLFGMSGHLWPLLPVVPVGLLGS